MGLLEKKIYSAKAKGFWHSSVILYLHIGEEHQKAEATIPPEIATKWDVALGCPQFKAGYLNCKAWVLYCNKVQGQGFTELQF